MQTLPTAKRQLALSTTTLILITIKLETVRLLIFIKELLSEVNITQFNICELLNHFLQLSGSHHTIEFNTIHATGGKYANANGRRIPGIAMHIFGDAHIIRNNHIDQVNGYMGTNAVGIYLGGQLNVIENNQISNIIADFDASAAISQRGRYTHQATIYRNNHISNAYVGIYCNGTGAGRIQNNTLIKTTYPNWNCNDLGGNYTL